jgi:HEAT repeat protein
MTSEDARVRASAVEALVGRATNAEDARSVFRAALQDKNHRVVGNALVGLYSMGDKSALDEMIVLSKHKDHLFRAAMAWAMGFVKDIRAIPTLREMNSDPSLVVRKRALNSLLMLEKLEMAQAQTNLVALAEATQPPAEVASIPEPEAETIDVNFFQF